MSVVNFLKETMEAIELSGRTPEQIVFIGSERSGHECTWQEFLSLADFNYLPGHSAVCTVAKDLIIVFSDGQKMWRGYYDDAEWWEYSTPFVRPSEKKPINSLSVKSPRADWEDLEDVQT